MGKMLAAGSAGVALAVAGTLGATAGAHVSTGARGHAARPAAARSGPVVKLGHTLAGALLVDGRGYTIYMFSRERHGRDVCARIHSCLIDWPAVTTTSRRPTLGAGLKRSLVGTIPYKGDLRMVTYHGWPLHTYKFDSAPRSVMNVGNTQFGGDWWALSASGKLVK